MSNDYDFSWVDEPEAFDVAANRLMRGAVRRPLERRSVPLADALTASISPFIEAFQNRNRLQHPGEALFAPAASVTRGVNRLYGVGGEGERFQTFPERMARSAISTVQDAAKGEFGTIRVPESGMVSDEDIARSKQKDFQGVMDLSNAAVGGGLLVGKPDLKSAGRTLGSGMVPKSGKREPVPIFYSGVEHALESTNLGTSTADQWLGTLKNAKGVKPEELQWLGVEEFLAEKKAKGEKVTRAELQDFVAQNKIEVKDIHKSSELGGGQGSPWDREISNEMHDAAADAVREAFIVANPRLREGTQRFEVKLEEFGMGPEGERVYNDFLNKATQTSTRYGDYQLPGGRDYGELLLTLPSQKEPSGRYIVGLLDSTKLDMAVNTKSEAQDALKDLKAQYGENGNRFIIKPEMRPVNEYTTSHWDEPNVLAHVRYNTRDIDGQKTLHVEEIQSDWHQQGKKKGYQNPKPISKEDVEVKYFPPEVPEGRDPSNYPGYWESFDKRTGKMISRHGGRMDEQAVFDEALKDFNNYRAKEGVPDAPFKKSWPELAFKRMLRYAAENGYDAISWTPGEAQAARYDLSKQIDEIRTQRLSDDTYRVTAVPKGGPGRSESIVKEVTAKELPDMVGKDMAEKILKNPALEKDGYTVHKGVDLKVGGEGMMRFYDDQLVAIASKYAKAHGGKVEQKPLGNTLEINKIDGGKGDVGRQVPPVGQRDQWIVDDPNNPDFAVQAFLSEKEAKDYVKQHSPNVHFMELPSSLRDTALRKGFPLFSHGVMLTPVDGNPFEAKKERDK